MAMTVRWKEHPGHAPEHAPEGQAEQDDDRVHPFRLSPCMRGRMMLPTTNAGLACSTPAG